MQFFVKVAREFKEFAIKGSVVDLAVGIIIGGAFGKIVSSLVNDVIMPPIGAVTRGADFRKWQVVLNRGQEGTADVTLNYGAFMQQAVEFLLVAWAVFLLVKGINKLRRKKEAEPAPKPAELSKQEQLLIEIRDLLKK